MKLTIMDELLSWFGTERYEQDLASVERFWAGEGRFLISLTTSKHGYRQNFDGNPVQMAAENLRAQASLPGINLPSLFADYGTISTARYWGGTVHGHQEQVHPYIDPVAQTLEEALALRPAAVDDPQQDAHRGLELWRRVSQRLGTQSLWLRTPDMQGTLNTAGLIMNQEELMMGMYAEPQLVHAFLDKVCSFLIEYARHLRQQTQGRICGNIWPYTFYTPKQGVALTEDLMPLLPADLYREFGIPYLRKIQQALGGLHIHCCGNWGHHVANLRESGLKIDAMEFHHPDTRLEELEPLAGTTVFIPYLMGHKQEQFKKPTDFYRHLIEHTPARFRYWFALPDDGEDSLRFARDYLG